MDEIEWMRVGQLGKLLDFFRDRARAARDHGRTNRAGEPFQPASRLESVAFALAAEDSEMPRRSSARSPMNWPAAESSYCPRPLSWNICSRRSGTLRGRNSKSAKKRTSPSDWKSRSNSARSTSGQTVVVKNGTVLAVEAFEGTNEAIKRGGSLGRKNAIVIKVTKPNQDMRFDVPVIGLETLRIARKPRSARSPSRRAGRCCWKKPRLPISRSA